MLIATNLVHEVNTSDGTLRILDDINLKINPGESIAVVGASGSGKTTLLSMLAGLEQPSGGHILFMDQDLCTLNEEARAVLRQRYSAFVFQNFQLIAGLSALENIALPLQVRGDRDSDERARYWLERVGLARRGKHLPRQLSGGEQQRVALARAFACGARILFADEPTGNLDTSTGAQIAELLFELNREQSLTLVLVTHSLELAGRCQRRVSMQAGRLLEEN